MLLNISIIGKPHFRYKFTRFALRPKRYRNYTSTTIFNDFYQKKKKYLTFGNDESIFSTIFIIAIKLFHFKTDNNLFVSMRLF